MNAKRIVRWSIVLLLLAALPGLTAALTGKNDTIVLNDYEFGSIWFDPATEGCSEDLWHFTMPHSGYVLIDNWAHGASDYSALVCLEGGAEPICAPRGSKALIFYSLNVGDYAIRIGGGEQVEEDGICYNYTLILASPLLISAAAGGLGTGVVDSIPFQSGDILAWTRLVKGNTDKWWLLFDASDVGINRNVTNIGKHSGDELQLTLGAQQSLPNVGIVTPYDIIVFDPIRLGNDTAGTFHMGFDGSENQLTTSSEKLDAIAESRYCDFLSTVGTAKVPFYMGYNIRFKDEDLGCWYQDTEWLYGFEGRFVKGLPLEDVIAAAYNDSTDEMYLTIQGNGNIADHRVTQKDIFAINSSDYTWGGLLWHGPDHGWNYNIDAIEYGGQ